MICSFHGLAEEERKKHRTSTAFKTRSKWANLGKALVGAAGNLFSCPLAKNLARNPQAADYGYFHLHGLSNRSTLLLK